MTRLTAVNQRLRSLRRSRQMRLCRNDGPHCRLSRLQRRSRSRPPADRCGLHLMRDRQADRAGCGNGCGHHPDPLSLLERRHFARNGFQTEPETRRYPLIARVAPFSSGQERWGTCTVCVFSNLWGAEPFGRAGAAPRQKPPISKLIATDQRPPPATSPSAQPPPPRRLGAQRITRRLRDAITPLKVNTITSARN
jgi:hypothetical protein